MTVQNPETSLQSNEDVMQGAIESSLVHTSNGNPKYYFAKAPSGYLLITDTLYRMADINFLNGFRLHFLDCLSLLRLLLKQFDFWFTGFACHPKNTFTGSTLFFLRAGAAADAATTATVSYDIWAFLTVLKCKADPACHVKQTIPKNRTADYLRQGHQLPELNKLNKCFFPQCYLRNIKSVQNFAEDISSIQQGILANTAVTLPKEDADDDICSALVEAAVLPLNNLDALCAQLNGISDYERKELREVMHLFNLTHKSPHPQPNSSAFSNLCSLPVTSCRAQSRNIYRFCLAAIVLLTRGLLLNISLNVITIHLLVFAYKMKRLSGKSVLSRRY
uniref:Expressed protein n=1 Tax=Echinococcus granulosus TaxID=6210 RepID=A0A068WUH9_ECHGR|nr:expressed protein [Echinococcus granulosus]